jgi:hypothetical protein
MRSGVQSGQSFHPVPRGRPRLARYKRLWKDVVAENDKYRLKISGEFMLARNFRLPRWIEIQVKGHDGPNQYARVEIRDDVPRLVELCWRAEEHQSEIRQKHLREAIVATILDVYAMTVIDRQGDKAVLNIGEEGSAQDRKIRQLLNELELARKGKRPVTSELLRQVADVYRANIDKAPTEAVARTFGVRSRMASTYVQRARERGLLPPTTQGIRRA